MSLYIVITNKTGAFDRADYHYEVSVNDEIMRAGDIRNIDRQNTSYAELMVLVAAQVIISGNPKPKGEGGK